MEVYLMKSWRC